MLLNKRIPFTYILKKVKIEFISVFIISLSVVLITEKYREFLPEIPFNIPAFIGTAISILLSFKLSQSYDRWWEARKVWGSIVNDSRSLVIQLQTFARKGNDSVIKRIAYRQIGWCYSLGQTLRGLDPTENLEAFFSAEDLRVIMTHNNKPLALLQLHGMDIRELEENGQLTGWGQLQLDKTLVRLCDSQGKCERIKSTIFPKTYRLFLHFIIYLFVVALSISMDEVGGLLEILLLLVLAMAFFLLEKSATHMQDPFENRPTDTPMTTLARNIEINIRQLLNESDVPEPLKSGKFYQL
jgi:putative membrane protein